MTPTRPEQSSRAASVGVGLLLSLTTIAILVALFTTSAWLRASHRVLGIRDLPEADRQRLLEEAVAINPGIYEQAWYQPEIGYTLKRNATLDAWHDRFTTNDLGFRTRSVRKSEEAYRIVVVGDSWTYGMGIREAESFPRVLEGLVARNSGIETGVEVFSLALPGYNTINETAALSFFYARLRPDAVVFVPSSNDNHSSLVPLPDGSLYAGTAGTLDGFGDPHHVSYRLSGFCNSYRYLERWRRAFVRLRTSEVRLTAGQVPTFFFFVARWRPEIVHSLVGQAGLQSPYTIVPRDLTLGKWMNDNDLAHGNPAANRLYAQLLYRLLAPHLGWAPLPEDALASEIADTPLFGGGPPAGDWENMARRRMVRENRRQIPSGFRVADQRRSAWAGPGNTHTGVFGHATTLLLRRPANATNLDITVRRLDDIPWIYPLELHATIPSPSGGSRVSTIVPDDGDALHHFSLRIPADLEQYEVLDLQIVASDVAAASEDRVAVSVAIESAEPRTASLPSRTSRAPSTSR